MTSQGRRPRGVSTRGLHRFPDVPRLKPTCLLLVALAGCGAAPPATPSTPRHEPRAPVELRLGSLRFGSTLDELADACANAGGRFWTETSAAGGCHPRGVRGAGVDAFCDEAVLSPTSAERPVFMHVYYDPSAVATMATLRFGPNHPRSEVEAIWRGVFAAMEVQRAQPARPGTQIDFHLAGDETLRLRASETVHATEITLELFRSRSLVCG